MSVTDAPRRVKPRSRGRAFARAGLRARALALAGIVLLGMLVTLAGLVGSPFAHGAAPWLADGPTPQTHCGTYPVPC